MKYTDEVNVQILISLLKQSNIKKIVISPGVRNISFVAGIQDDPFFEKYSVVDERSAAYIACGLAEESGEPVVITCTEATAPRNYMPGLTEAYYKHLPILVVACTWGNEMSGHLFQQKLDQTVIPNDVAKANYLIPEVKDKDDEWVCTMQINKALHGIKDNGGGPVYLNLESKRKKTYVEMELPQYRLIQKVRSKDELNSKSLEGKKVVIAIGTHQKWTEQQIEILERFCMLFDAVVIGDHTCNYRGKYFINFPLIKTQEYLPYLYKTDVVIHFGGITGAHLKMPCTEVWRVHEDGVICDTFKKLSCVFEMKEIDFLSFYVNTKKDKATDEEYKKYKAIYEDLKDKIPELPFSNLWIAQQIGTLIPNNSIINLGIYNSLRAWSMFEVPTDVTCYSNVGGFGIDGLLSTLVGSSLSNPSKLCYCILGDLAFFYDMNVLGNRHIKSNVRILLINNGRGVEFCNYNNSGAVFGDKVNDYIAASGHYSCNSNRLVESYAKGLGFEYICASNKEEFNTNKSHFLSKEEFDKPIIFEIFTNPEDESNALKLMNNIYKDERTATRVKGIVKNIVGEKGINNIKGFLGKNEY